MIKLDFIRRQAVLATAVVIQGCAALPANAPDDIVETIFDPRGNQHAVDSRQVFREFFCTINETRGPTLPDHRACDDALRTLLPEEPPLTNPRMTHRPARPMTIIVVPGFGHECFSNFISEDGELEQFIESLGHVVRVPAVRGLANSDVNAAIIRDSVMEDPEIRNADRIVMVGYSKGANDILAALASYPEIAERTDAVVSLAGAVAGSPLSLHAKDWTLGLLAALPGTDCEVPEDTALASLNPSIRHQWLADNPLPTSVAYFSIISYPESEKISATLRPSFRILAKHDSRNDGQMIAIDQVIPGAEILAFVNADHWAVALPIARLHPLLTSAGINRNDFPVEVLLEAVFDYVDTRLDHR